MDLAGVWRAFAAMTGPAAMAALWQGVAVALGLAVCLRWTPRISAGDRFRAWLAGFAALAVLPFLPTALAWAGSMFGQGAAAAGMASSAPEATLGGAWLHLDPRWSFVVAGLWLAGSLARAVDLGMHTARLRRLWKRATPLRSLPEKVGGRRVEVCTTRDLDRPSVIGFFAPRILIPEWLLERLTAEELEQVVLHEAEHLRRRDDWINLAQKLCLMVFPLNPALAWMERRLCGEREMACDEAVVRRTRAPRAYAACLASLAERGLERRVEALSLGAWQRRPELVLRVHRILRRGPGLPPALARTVLGVVSCGLVFGSVELAQCPQLVAFASQPAAEAAAPVEMPAISTPAMSGFHAYNAVAHVPSRAELAATRAAQQRPARPASKSRHTEESREAAPMLASHTRRKDAAQPEGAELASRKAPVNGVAQQVVVFTAWQQLETATPAANSAAEDEADAVLNDPAAPLAQPARANVVREYTVTRVILSVYPAAASHPAQAGGKAAAAQRAGSKAGGSAGSANDPTTPAPAAIPVRAGWLVIQL